VYQPLTHILATALKTALGTITSASSILNAMLGLHQWIGTSASLLTKEILHITTAQTASNAQKTAG
jgi:hypothetical protein